WLLNPPDQSLPFVLADAGVDVWLGNNRGNSHSKRHVTLDPDQREFWDFSWEEMAQYDLPAEINYVLGKTGDKQLYYIGYSQGSAIGFAKFSEDQELAKKIKHFIALAPVARVGSIKSALRLLAPFSGQINTFLNMFGGGAVDTSPTIIKTLSAFMCGTGLGETLCMHGLTPLVGDMNCKSINKSKIDVYQAHSMSSTSAKTLMHWAQMVKSKRFQHFDYGAKENYWRYGQSKPLLYHPANIKVPVTMFSGGKDTLSDPKDVAWLLTQVNVTGHTNIPWYNHLSLVLGYDAKDYMYPDLVPIITGKPWISDN
ncbi:hypothetical protein EGW08_009674, partial [Elysia chlorotica]